MRSFSQYEKSRLTINACAILDTTNPEDFTLPSNARVTLANLLIIHPVACLLTLILFVLTITSHFNKPGHSPKYLLALVFFSIFTCIVALVAFLVDILLFVPHLDIGGYIVVGAPICLAIAVVGLCATRRRVVSKEERKRRIAEAAATTSANNQNNSFGVSSAMVTGTTAAPSSNGDKLPEFATFEVNKHANEYMMPEDSGERIPLNPRLQSPPPPTSSHSGPRRAPSDLQRGYDPEHPNPSSVSGFSNGSRGARGPNPAYGAPLPPSHRLPLNNGPNAYGAGGAFGAGPADGAYGPSNPPRYRGPPGPPPNNGPYRGPNPPPGSGGFPPRNGPPNYGPGPNGRGFVGGYDGESGGNYGGHRGPRGNPQGFVAGGVMGPGPRRGPPPPNQYQSEDGYYQEDAPSGPPNGGYKAYVPPSTNVMPGAGALEQPGRAQQSPVDYQSDDDSRGQPSREDFIATALAPGPGRTENQATLGAELAANDPRVDGRATSSIYDTDDAGRYVFLTVAHRVLG